MGLMLEIAGQYTLKVQGSLLIRFVCLIQKGHEFQTQTKNLNKKER